MTWSALFLALFAFAALFTLVYAVFEEAFVFSSAMALASWTMLAFVPEVTIVSGGDEVMLQIGAVRYLFAGLAIISALALLGALLGFYPEEMDDTERDIAPEAINQ